MQPVAIGTTDLRGRIASWRARIWDGAAAHEIRRYGVIETVETGQISVLTLRAYDPHTPPEEEGKLRALADGEWQLEHRI